MPNEHPRSISIEVRPLQYVKCMACWGLGYIRAAATCMVYECHDCDGKGWK